MTGIVKFVLLSLLFVMVERAPCFDLPDWDAKFVDLDGVQLQPSDREMLVDALTAVAANFPDSPHLDEDLREKAIFLAMKINPLHGDARRTYRALAAGEKPPETNTFKKSVSRVSEALWHISQKLQNGPSSEPAAIKLVPYLEELALLIDPDPEPGKVGAFIKSQKDSPPNWKPYLSLQPADSPSNGKIKRLIEEWKEPIVPPKVTMRNQEVPTPPTPPTLPDDTLMPPPQKRLALPLIEADPNTSTIAKRQARIPVTLAVQGIGRRFHWSGELSLLVRTSEREDLRLFRVETDATESEKPPLNFDMKLMGVRTGIQMLGLDKATALLKRDYPNWPEREIAQLEFHPPAGLSSPPRSTEGDFSLTASLLMESALSGNSLSEKMMFTGGISELLDEDAPIRFSTGEDLSESILAVHQIEETRPAFLVMPDDQLPAMLASLIANRDLKYLFEPQLISFSSWEELKTTAFGEDEAALLSASDEFKAIQAVQDKMSLIDLSRNDKVKERLNKILSIYPRHLSARLMLEFGNSPDDPKAMNRLVVREIDELMTPVFEYLLELAHHVRRGTVADSTEVQTKAPEMNKALDRIYVDAGAVKPYINLCRDLMANLESYVSTGNKTSTLGLQRFEYIKLAMEKLNDEREKMEVKKISIDESEYEFRPRKFRPPLVP